MHCTEPTKHIATKKPHRCEWCYEAIPIGDHYYRYRSYDGGDVCTIKMHPECLDDAHECARMDGGNFEFCPGSQERPPKQPTTQGARDE